MSSNKINRLYQIIVGTFVVFLSAAAIFQMMGLRINISNSAPLGIYRLESRGKISRGDCIAINTEWDKKGIELGIHKRPHRMLKLVEGVPGDKVEYLDDLLTVNARQIPGSTIKETDSKGRKLPHPAYPYVISEDHYLAISVAHEEGAWDSRYFGPVPISAITNKCTLVWGWK